MNIQNEQHDEYSPRRIDPAWKTFAFVQVHSLRSQCIFHCGALGLKILKPQRGTEFYTERHRVFLFSWWMIFSET